MRAFDWLLMAMPDPDSSAVRIGTLLSELALSLPCHFYCPRYRRLTIVRANTRRIRPELLAGSIADGYHARRKRTIAAEVAEISWELP